MQCSVMCVCVGKSKVYTVHYVHLNMYTCILEWLQISYRSGGFLPLGVFSVMLLKWAILVTRGPFRFQVAVFYFEHL